MEIGEFQPTPKLVTGETAVTHPRFPVIDAHNHLGEFGGHWANRAVPEFMAALDNAGVTHYVDLDGGWGEAILQARLDKFKTAVPDRYLVFGGVAWGKWADKGHRFGEWAADRLQEQARWGRKA